MREKLEKPVFAAAVIFLAAYGVGRGLFGLRATFSVFSTVIVVAATDAVISSMAFSSVLLASAGLFGYKLFRDDETETGKVRRKITAVVPVYEDAELMHISGESLLESDATDRVLFSCEEGDMETLERAEQLAEKHERIDFTVNGSSPGSKAGAVNHAVKEVENDFFGVFDVDEEVNPDFVSRAAELLEERDVVQGRAMMRPDGFLESVVFLFEHYFNYFGFQLPQLLTGYRWAGSRTTVMRKDAFEEAGGYSPEVLTEDYEFSFRAYINGLDVVETYVFPSTINAPHSPGMWWKQRKRWMRGYFQVFFRLSKSLRRRRGRREVLAFLISLGTLAGVFLLTAIAAKFALLFLLDAEIFFFLPLLTVALLSGLFGLRDSMRYNLSPNWFALLFTPFVMPAYGAVAVKAFAEAVSGREQVWESSEKQIPV
ncbi:MAG: glycosyltransferase family 2 protein [Candidatus Nanohaloarchaea archaeon]